MAGELEFKRWVRSKYKGWSAAFGPGMGGEVGTPDICLGGLNGTIVWLELKIGKIVDEAIFLSEIRPIQYQWMWRLRKAGGLGGFLVGVKDKRFGWRGYLLPGMQPYEFQNLSKHKNFLIRDCLVVTEADLVLGPEHMQRLAFWLLPLQEE